MRQLLLPFALLLPFLPAFCFQSTHAQSVSDCHLEDQTIAGSATYEAAGTLSARAVTVASSADVTFRAGSRVRLEAGFQVESGAAFRAEVSSSTSGSCGGVMLSDLPPHASNDRFDYEDVFKNHIVRPALSVRGFDSDRFIDQGDYGLGLKQILHRVYNKEERQARLAFGQILTDTDIAFTPISDTDRGSRADIEQNVRLLQARAFVALVTYVLEQNGTDIQALNAGNQDLPLPTHAEALAQFREPWEVSGGFYQYAFRVTMNIENGDDPVKWTRSLTMMARAVDLYLALENAYDYYGGAGRQAYNDPNSTTLLSLGERGDLMVAYQQQIAYLRSWAMAPIEEVEKLPVELVATLPFVSLFISYGIRSVNLDDIQPGNYPLIQKTAYGYASLGAQRYTGNSYDSRIPDEPYEDWLGEAVRAAGAPAGQERKKYWGYQTDDGKRFFAEGPYYLQFALKEVIPFWHAMRGNNFGNQGAVEYGGHTVVNPFRNSLITTPLHWMADIVTPDGRTPPLDDGDKYKMANTNVMRWSGRYGDAELGKKYTWISESPANDGVTSNPNLLPVALAIPLADVGQEPAATIGNTDPAQTGEGGEQQVVVRRQDGAGRTHYVLLNGEHGDAVDRGEGHEQPDNLQLLYYVDGTSYLMDSGYDDSEGRDNSTWNHYYDHNVLHYYADGRAEGNEGGLYPPGLRLEKKRIVSDKDEVGEVKDLWVEQHGNITALNAGQPIQFRASNFGYESESQGFYRRTVLFVGGDAPYLVDLNRLNHTFKAKPEFEKFQMVYHANSTQYLDISSWRSTEDGFIHWNEINEDPGRSLRAFPMSVERELINDPNAGNVGTYDVRMIADRVEEEFRGDKDIRKLTLDDMRLPWYTVSTILQAEENQAMGSQHDPQVLFDYPVGLSSWTDRQGWVWKQDSDTYDVFMARSVQAGNGQSREFSLYELDEDLPLHLTLPAGHKYGFARVQRENGQWSIDPDYQIGFEITPMHVSVTSSGAAVQGEQMTFTATARYGRDSAPYTYEWYHSEGQFPGGGTLVREETTSSSTDAYTRTVYTAPGEFFSVGAEVTKGEQSASGGVSVYVAFDCGGSASFMECSDGCPPGEVCTFASSPAGGDSVATAAAATAPPPTASLVGSAAQASGGPSVATAAAYSAAARAAAPHSAMGDSATVDAATVDQATVDSTSGTPSDSAGTHIALPDGRRLVAGEGIERDSLSRMAQRVEAGGLIVISSAASESPEGPAAPATSVPVGADARGAPAALPQAFAVEQNYPNPFRQRTRIDFALPEAARVEITVYDLLGRAVLRPVSRELPAGYHHATVDAGGLSSGIYIYRFRAGDFHGSGKMTVVK